MQGELEKRIDRYGMSRKSGFTWNRFTVKNLTIVNNWDIMYTLPERLRINLSKNTAWYLGIDIELHETEKGKTFTTVRNDNHVANDDTNDEINVINR